MLLFALLIFVSITSAEKMLSVEVKCQECDIKIVSGRYELRPNAGEKIILTAYSSGGIGNKNYLWTKDSQQVCIYSSCPITVSEETEEYILTVSDDVGSIKKWIRIIPKSLPQKCLPIFKSGIDLDDEVGRKEWSAGDAFNLEVRLDKSDCPDSDSDYSFHWESDNSGIIFSSPYSTETEVRIIEGARIGDTTIKAVLSNNFQKRKKEIIIKIVDNTPPEIVSIRYDKPLSYTRFNVYVDATSGESGNEGNDFVQCSIIFKNETGRIVDSDSRTIKSGDFNFVFRLRPEGREIYSIEVALKDSHGMISLVAIEMFKVEKGDTGKDIPVIFVSDIIYCTQGEECKIDASETHSRDKDISTFGYYLDGKEILNKDGNICSGRVGSFVFDYPDTFEIEVRGKYFGNDNIGSKIITVVVSKNETTPALISTLTPAPTSIETSRYRYVPGISQTSASETPGMGLGLTIATIIAVAFAIRRKNKH